MNKECIIISNCNSSHVKIETNGIVDFITYGINEIRLYIFDKYDTDSILSEFKN